MCHFFAEGFQVRFFSVSRILQVASFTSMICHAFQGCGFLEGQAQGKCLKPSATFPARIVNSWIDQQKLQSSSLTRPTMAYHNSNRRNPGLQVLSQQVVLTRARRGIIVVGDPRTGTIWDHVMVSWWCRFNMGWLWRRTLANDATWAAWMEFAAKKGRCKNWRHLRHRWSCSSSLIFQFLNAFEFLFFFF